MTPEFKFLNSNPATAVPEGEDKTWSLRRRIPGLRGLGFRGLGFGGLGFRGLRVEGSGV